MRIWNFLFRINRVFKHKVVVSIPHVCSNSLGKMWPSFTFNFSTRILTSTYTKEFKFYLALYMTRCPTINFHLSIMSKWLAKHIRMKVSFKTPARKRHVYNDIGWTWIWNQCFYMGIWNNDRTQMMVLPSFHLATRFNWQNA